MDSMFIDILKKLMAEQGRGALLNAPKCKAFLADYTHGEYKKESRLLLQALDAGVQKAIDATEELAICKQQQVRVLEEDYSLKEEVAADVVDTLAMVLRGEAKEEKKKFCKKCGKELQEGWKTCPFCETSVVDRPETPVVTASNTSQSSAEALVECGEEYLQNGDYDNAIKQFDEAVRSYPNYAPGYAGRGEAYIRQNQFDKGIMDLSEAIKLDPNNNNYLSRRDEIYQFQMKSYELITTINDKLVSDPNNSKIYNFRGTVYRTLGKKNEAIQDFEKALALDPNCGSAKQELRELRGY